MNDAHQDFVEIMRAGLVNPRRNVRRVIERLESGEDPGDYMLTFARTALEDIEGLEARVAAEETRTIHTCSCGHTHYAHGETT